MIISLNQLTTVLEISQFYEYRLIKFLLMPSAFPIFILAVQISILTIQKKFGRPKKFSRPKKNLDVQKNFDHPKTSISYEKTMKKIFWTTKFFFGRPNFFWENVK